MRFYEDYLKKEEIIRRTKKYGFPQPWLIELLVYDFEIFRQLLEISKNFILKGGAAAQIYLPPNQQRASIDIDLLTGLKPAEIEAIFLKGLNKQDFVNVKVHKPKKAIGKLPLITYLVDLPSAVKGDETIQLKVDILFEEIDSYRTHEIGNRELFALKIDDKIPCIKLGSLVADKLLTLASKSVGIGESKQGQLPKHVYDLSRLMDLIEEDDFDDLLFSFEKIAKAEMSFRSMEHRLEDVIKHIDETLTGFTRIDKGDTGFKKPIIDFQSAYVNRDSRAGLQEWIISCLRLRYLLKIIREVLINKKNKDESYKKFSDCEKELNQISELDIRDKRTLRENLLNEARDRITDWKFLKGKSEERIFLEMRAL